MFLMTHCYVFFFDIGMPCIHWYHFEIFDNRSEWPSTQKFLEFSSMIQREEESFIEVFGFWNGFNVPMQKSPEP